MFIAPRKKHVLDIYGREPETLDDLARCVIAVIERETYYRAGGREGCKVLGFAWDITYNDHVSNSHSAPVGYPTNFSPFQNPGRPTGYPGWQGRVWIRFEYWPTFGSAAFERTLTHTGTGGGGAYNGPWTKVSHSHFSSPREIKDQYPEPQIYSWDYRLYELDWPGIKVWREQQELIDRLSGTNRCVSHNFQWTDPDTARRDLELIARVAEQNAKSVITT